MLVTLFVVSTLFARPPQVHSALETLKSCSDMQAESCRFAADWLKMGGEAALPEVLKEAPGMTQAGQLLTVNAVGQMGVKGAVECLGKLAQDRRMDSMARALALEQLSKRPADRRVRTGPAEYALTLVEDSDETVRQAAVRLIANRVTSKDTKLIKVLIESFQDKDGGVRSEAVFGFGQCGCKEAAPMLALALRDKDMRVRRSTVDALAVVRHPVVVPELIDMMSMRDNSLNVTIARALRFQSGQAFGTDAREWKAWQAQNR